MSKHRPVPQIGRGPQGFAQSLSKNVYPTKAEFAATMTQLYGDRVHYADMQGNRRSVDDLSQGQLWLDGEYVGFWG